MPEYRGYQMSRPATVAQRRLIRKMEWYFKDIRGASQSPRLTRETAQKIINHYHDQWLQLMEQERQDDAD